MFVFAPVHQSAPVLYGNSEVVAVLQAATIALFDAGHRGRPSLGLIMQLCYKHRSGRYQLGRIYHWSLLCLALALSGCGAAGQYSPGSSVIVDTMTEQSSQPLNSALTPTVPVLTQPMPTTTPATGTTAVNTRRPCEQANGNNQANSKAYTTGNGAVPVAEPTRANITYDAKRNTITLKKGARVTLPDVALALNRPKLLHAVGDGEWLLAANLMIEQGASLNLSSPTVRWLKLRSDDAGFVSVRVLGGRLDIRQTCITSWDESAGSVDRQYTDGRSYILARDGATMNVQDARLSFLGYDANESYGVAWRLTGTTGEITNSVFAYNFYGLYAYEASGLVIRANEVHHSVRYGIDPHTRSNKLVIEDNHVHHNGKQGIILAEGCSNSVIRDNIVHDNALHGIVIYQGSNNNVIENNTTYKNGMQGINVNNATDNVLRNNTVYENGGAGIGIGQRAEQNVVVGNTVERNGKDGISVYSAATGATLEDNTIRDNARYGIYIKSKGNQITTGNEITGNLVGVFLNTSPPPHVATDANQIYGNREADVKLKAD